MKSRITLCLVAMFAVLLLVPASWADWGTSFKSLGKTPTIGDASCVSPASGQVWCAMRNQQHTMMVNEFTSGAWSGWTNLPGSIASNPSCASDQLGHIMCGVVNDQSSMGVIEFDGTNWGAFQDSGIVTSLDPSCSFYKKGKVFCAVRSVAGALTGSLFDGTAWAKVVTAKGVTITTAPGCASDSNGDVICEMLGMVNNLQVIEVNRFIGTKWEGFLTLPGNGADGATCTSLGTKGQVACFIRAINTVIYGDQFKSGTWTTTNWTGFVALTSNSEQKSSCGQVSSGSIACAFINQSDSLMYARTFDGTNWGSYLKVGTVPSIGGPSCSGLSSGNVLCVVIGTNTQAQSVTGP